jgi:5,10-methylenetetrahydrofolate reductase
VCSSDLLDREKLIELLVELLRPENTENSEKLYKAIDDAARQIGESSSAV